MEVQTRPFIGWPNSAGTKSFQELEIDGMGLRRLRGLCEGPMFVTSLNAVRQRADMYMQSLRSHFPLARVFYAMKANAAPAILQEVAKAGCGVDIVSIGEFRAARAAGVSASEICFAGVGKSQSEIVAAIDAGLGVINVEHAQELTFVLDLLSERRLAAASGKGKSEQKKNEPLVALRLNPCVESQTHPHLKTGALDSKFGMLLAQVEDWLHNIEARFSHSGKNGKESFKDFVAPLCGLHVHIGSQLQSHDVFPLVLERVQQCVMLLLNKGIRITQLDLGGGLGVGVAGVPVDASDIRVHVDFQAQALKAVVSSNSALQDLWGSNCEKLTVCLEPGRSMVASSTVFLSEVLYEKSNIENIRFAYVDAGMNAFPRPAIYGAEHATACANKPNVNLLSYKVFGPVCESGDILARDARLPQLFAGDVVVFFEAGAYCRSMASHYNLRAIPAEIFVRGGEVVELIPAQDPTAGLNLRALNSDAFAAVIHARRSVRVFETEQPIPETVVRKAIDHALLAPNSSNMQMWEFYWVRTPEKKKALAAACLSQPAARTAAELIVCVARTDTWPANRLRMLDFLRANGNAPASVIKYYEKLLPFVYGQGLLGIGGLFKSLATWFIGLFRPIPREPVSRADMRVWASKSTALGCENLILSLRAQGYDTCAMEGFDSRRVKKIIGLPRRGSDIVMVIGAGVGKPEGLYGPRVRFDRKFYAFEV
ncbi:MAG: hypothetical protein RLZZ488_1802 [Pseudomonadota bacterium]